MSAGTLERATAAVTPDPELQAIAHDLAARARRYERARDSRCVFTHAYAMLTRRLASQLGSAGFRDPEFILAVGRGFHERYAMALDAWDRGSDVPETWRYVFGEMTGRRTSPLEDLVLGVYTHIVHDLTLVLADLAAVGRLGSVGDFHLANALIAETVPGIQREVSRRYSPWFSWLDRLGREFDLVLTDYGVRLARGMAWYNAQRLLDPHAAPDARRALDASATTFLRRLLDPPLVSLRIVLRAGRWTTSLFRRWPRDES